MDTVAAETTTTMIDRIVADEAAWETFYGNDDYVRKVQEYKVKETKA